MSSATTSGPRSPWARVKTPADLGRFLRRRRLDLRLSQEEVAKTLGFHRNYLQEIESGKDVLAYRRLFDLARELGVELRVQARPAKTPDDGANEDQHGPSAAAGSDG